LRDFDQFITEQTSDYQGLHANLIRQAPALFRLLNRLLEDPNLPGRLRPLILAGVAYFALSTEIIPEDLEGPSGYIDDVFLAALVANQVQQVLESGEILQDNWDGEIAVLPLLAEILSHEKELIGDRRELILWYIGYEYLAN